MTLEPGDSIDTRCFWREQAIKLRLVLVPSLFLLAQGPGHSSEFIRGEVNSDGRVNVADPVSIVMGLFPGGDPPGCEDAADTNDDGVVELSDAVYELMFLFAFPCGDAPHETPLAEDEIFDRLTRNAWIRVDPSGFTTFTSYAFQKSGRYFFCQFSDIPEGADAGLWNFEKLSDSGGHLFLDGKEMLRFSLREDGSLWIVTTRLEPGEYNAGFSFECESPPPDCAGCTRSELPAVALPPIAETLAGTRWLKANDFNTFSEPTGLEFPSPGRFNAIFRGGECSFASFWSLSQDYFVFEDLDCDFRLKGYPVPSYRGRRVILEESSLRFDDQEVYLHEGSDMTRGSVVLMVYHAHGGNGYNASLTGSYDRPFRRGSNSFHFRMLPLQLLSFPYGEITFTRRSLERTQDGFTFVGEPSILARVALPPVLPGSGFEFDVDLVAPDAAGDFSFEADLDGEFRLFPGDFLATFP
jgi:hypothetical protein